MKRNIQYEGKAEHRFSRLIRQEKRSNSINSTSLRDGRRNNQIEGLNKSKKL